MSGPKYYNFPLGSPEEAAGIYAQLSAFQHGVKIRVVNNQLQFTVSESAWYQGATYSSIQSEIAKAKQRYEDNEELKRLLRENKEKEKARVKTRISGIDEEYKQEKTKLQGARSRCTEIKDRAVLSYITPFGTYDLKSELDKVTAIESAIVSELKSLDERRNQCVKACKDATNAIDNCNSMEELSSVQRTISGIRIPSSNVADSIDEVESSIKEKAIRLKNFTSFLNKLYEGMKDKDLMGYFERIKKEVATINVFDADAQRKIEKILTSIEAEIALLKEKEISVANAKEIKDKVSAQLKLLDDLSASLKPVLDSIVVENETTADYTRRSSEILKESDEVIARINELEFVNVENQNKVDRILKELLPLRNSAMSKVTIDKLQTIIAELHTLEVACKQGNEIYQQFKEEYKKYEELYVRLQGFLSADGSEIEEDEDEEQILWSPIEIILAYENPENQIKELKQKNAELTKILNGCTQEGMFGAIAAAVEKETWGEPLRKEKYKDGSLHFTYIRRESKGAIFDVDCGADGSTGIYPRGVVLCNGKPTITPEELQQVHSSCGWADEIHTAFASFGMSDSGSYEEMPEEVMQSLYDIKNYFYISSFEESVRFLHLSGYTEEEIETILDIEAVSDHEEKKRRRDIVANRARAIKK